MFKGKNKKIYKIFKAPRCEEGNITFICCCLCRSGTKIKRKKTKRLCEHVHVKRSDKGEHSYMLIPAPLCFFCGGSATQRVQAVLVCSPCGLAQRWGEQCDVPGALYSKPGSRGMEAGRRGGGGRKWNRKRRQGGREHRESVITFTPPDTAVRLTLDSYPKPFLHSPLQYLTLSVCLSLFTQSKQKLELTHFRSIAFVQVCFAILQLFLLI